MKKVVTRFLVFIVVACFAVSGFAQAGSKPAPPATDKPASTTVQKQNTDTDKQNTQSVDNGSSVEGRVVSINRITGEIIVANGNSSINTPVKVSPTQLNRIKIGQTVSVALKAGSSNATGLRVLRRNTGR
jgi:hypothetical protein